MQENITIIRILSGIMLLAPGAEDRFITGSGFAYLPNGHLVVGHSEADESLRVIDIEQFRVISSFSQQGYSADAIVCLQNGNIIVGSRDINATLRLFNPNNGTLIKTFPQYQRSVSTPEALTACMEFIKRREMEKNYQGLRLAKMKGPEFFRDAPEEIIIKIVLCTGDDLFNNDTETTRTSLTK